ncbi:MAG TPA: CBS domain-containing protein [Acidimicrobiia bacterium]|nr:CBS domain-containing protein [Acidimicrobiia bacterium]
MLRWGRIGSDPREERTVDIEELASRNVVSVTPGTPVRKAVDLMRQERVGSVAVVVDGAMEGIFTERDLVAAVAEFADLDREPVSSWMTPDPDTLGPETSVAEAAEWMLATGYRHLPVVNELGQLRGMVSVKDVLWAITEDAD